MFTDNRTVYIRREIMGRIAKLFFEGKLESEIDRIPMKVISRKAVPHRCCIEKDREMVRQRVISALGFGLENEDEIDMKLLSDFAKEAFEREKIESPILTFIAEGCNACVKVNYYVTEVCRSCVAKPCIMNCPRSAISAGETKAHIDSSKCVNCGKCLSVCPFNAIVYVPVPCEEACPTGAMHKDEHGRETIDYAKCIYCGKCIRRCPFGAVTEKSQIIDVMRALVSGETAALVAPAIVGQFPGTMGQIVEALRELGFSRVIEVALGADITIKAEAAEIVERLSAGDQVMGTSCCPAYVEAVRKHAKKFEPYVSHAKTPMAYTAEISRREYPSAKTVFIGPCVAKRHEGLSNPDVDFVITFEELGSLLMGKNIDVCACTESSFDLGSAGADARGFPVSSGVAYAVMHALGKNPPVDVKPVLVDGLTRKNIALLSGYAAGKCPGSLVEVMSCEGGCLHGPCVISNPVVSRKKLQEYTGAENPKMK
jgi:[FeFe] hydrogenase (group B1/B3)